jgi:hypothetical protein
MDDRVFGLITDFPQIFERPTTTLQDMDQNWVIIDVPGNGANPDELVTPEDLFLGDLDRFKTDNQIDPPDPIDDSSSLIDMSLPQNVDLDRNELMKIINRQRSNSIDKLRKKISGNFPGGPSASWVKESKVPPPDALAVYLPFHRYPNMWGIYILDAGVASLATDIFELVRLLGRSISSYDARKAALAYLFHHEAYHSAVEGFAIRCELPLRKPLYRKGLRNLYTKKWELGDPHEETLATAYGIRKVRDGLRLPKADIAAIVDALRIYMWFCTPPYKAGIDFLDDAKFDELERSFMEHAMQRSSSKTLPSTAWNMGTYLMAPLIQRNKKYSWICSRLDFNKNSKLAVHYFRQRDVLSCLNRLTGAVVEQGGRHHHHLVREFEEKGKNRRLMTPVPSGEIHKGTLGGMLKQLEIPLNVENFRNECRKIGKALS